MEKLSKYNWVSFYIDFAKKLLEYKDNRKKLIEIVENVFKKTDINMPTLGKDNKIIDLDPFTVFSLFNKNSMNQENRIKLIRFFAEELKIEKEVPTSFIGVPTVNSRAAVYYYFIGERNNDVDDFWGLFEIAIKYSENPTDENYKEFLKYFDIAINKKGIRTSKITIGLYWINPNKYLNLDSRNKWYIYESGKIPQKIVESLPVIKDRISAQQYFDIIEKINKYLQSDESRFQNFIELSENAWDYSEEINNQKKNNNEEKFDNANVSKKDENIQSSFIIENNVKEKGKNVIVYGVPGSGKSYYIKKKIGKTDSKYIERVIFYPEYTYYDFIGQKVPDGNGGLEFEEGNFTRILRKAMTDKKHQYYLIIEELNRGNSEAIFGDIFQLLDRKRDGNSEYTIVNTNLLEYLKDCTNEIFIPSNLTIYATVNNADQNVFNFDTAFGRRWEYEMMPCDPDELNKDESESKIYSSGYIKGTNIKWDVFRRTINRIILENKNEIYNAEEKRLGLYYISEDFLTKDESEEDDMIVEKFASKIFRYLYLNVFKNNIDILFKKSESKILETYIKEFVKNKNINDILKIDIENIREN